MEKKNLVGNINIDYKIKSAKIFYSIEDAAEFVAVKLVSGQIFDIGGAEQKVRVGSKRLETDVFVMDSRNFIYHRQGSINLTEEQEKQLFEAIVEYNSRPDSKVKIFTESEFAKITEQEKNDLNSLPIISKKIVEIDISKLEIINDDWEDIVMVTLNSGYIFALDGRMVGNYEDGIINYINVFVLNGGIYPCDEDGFAIIDRKVLRSKYVNEGFLREVPQSDGTIDYELTPQFDNTIHEAIRAYNTDSNARIKIVTEAEYEQLREQGKCTRMPSKFSEAFQRGNIVTIYSNESKKEIKSLMNKVKKICDDGHKISTESVDLRNTTK